MEIKPTTKFLQLLELFKNRQNINRNFDKRESIKLSFSINVDFKEKLVEIDLNIGTLSYCTLTGGIKDILIKNISELSNPKQFENDIKEYIDTVMYNVFIEYLIDRFVDELESEFTRNGDNYVVNMLDK